MAPRNEKTTPKKEDDNISFQSDFLGRINNISLAPSPQNALTPLFESITNAMQAIEERYGEDDLNKGTVHVRVLREKSNDSPEGFVISDNGIGLSDKNFEAFRTADTRNKIKKGGKGVGRFLWVKVFKKAEINSVFQKGGAYFARKFDFVADTDNQIRNISLLQKQATPGTVVTLKPFHSEYSAQCPKKSSTIRNKILAHFLRVILADTSPTIIFEDSNGSEVLRDVLKDQILRQQRYSFELPVNITSSDSNVCMHAYLLPKDLSDDEKGINAVFYAAHGRSVRRYDLDGALGLKAIQEKYAFFGFVESNTIDKYANQERTDFSWPEGFFEPLHRKVIEEIKNFLSEEIDAIRQRQIETVTKVRNEHLRFLNVVRNPKDFVSELSLSTQTPEEIFLELSRTSLREYNRKKRQFIDSKNKKIGDFNEAARNYTKELERESIASLAEYVYKRKLIIDVLEDRMAYSDREGKKFHLEEAVHELICPLREGTDSLNYEDHNLWLIDDALAFYSYFDSDKTMRRMTGGAEPFH